jgi:DNA-binding transcriptional regulator YhcF (GntR family)
MMKLSFLLEQPISLPLLISMASKYWIKLFHEILDDPKMARLADDCWRRSIELFLLAGDYAKGGLLPPFPDIAWRLRVEESALLQSLQELQSFGIIEKTDGGNWFVTHFKERQNAESPAERMRRFRDSQQKKEYHATTPSDNPVTDRNADIDKDKEVEEESEQEESSSSSISNNLSEVFVLQTKIPEFAGGVEKWKNALDQLNQSGIEEQDLVSAIQDCHRKNLTITCLTSILNPAIIARSKRLSFSASHLSPQEDYRRFTRGKFGDFGIR